MEEIQKLKTFIAKSDTINASASLNKFYDNWDALDPQSQQEIKNLEAIYLTVINQTYTEEGVV